MSSAVKSVRAVEHSEVGSCFELLQRVGVHLRQKGRTQRVASLPLATYERWQHLGWNFLIEAETQLQGIFSLTRETLAEWPDFTAAQRVHCLRTLAIAPEHQGKGLGRLAVTHALNMPRDGAPYLDCVEGSLPKFYETAGFNRVATRSVEVEPGSLLSIVLMRAQPSPLYSETQATYS